jgi:hypothetical protein
MAETHHELTCPHAGTLALRSKAKKEKTEPEARCRALCRSSLLLAGKAEAKRAISTNMADSLRNSALT